jgi:hypothetical protein
MDRRGAVAGQPVMSEQHSRRDTFDRRGPLAADHPLVTGVDICQGCGFRYRAGEFVTLVTIGPGDDAEARQHLRDGRSYNAVAIPAHWACVTGEE